MIYSQILAWMRIPLVVPPLPPLPLQLAKVNKYADFEYLMSIEKSETETEGLVNIN